MKYLEIYGLCGSGKTTLQSCIEGSKKDLLKISPPISVSRLRIIYYSLILYFKMFLSAPFGSRNYLLNRGYRRLLIKEGLRIAGIRERKKKGAYVTLLADSGVLMPIVSAVVEQNLYWDNKLIRLLLENLPLPEYVIFLDVTPEISRERYLYRESLVDYDLERFNSGYELCIRLCEWLKMKDINILRIDNAEKMNCENIMKKLTEYLRA